MCCARQVCYYNTRVLGECGAARICAVLTHNIAKKDQSNDVVKTNSFNINPLKRLAYSIVVPNTDTHHTLAHAIYVARAFCGATKSTSYTPVKAKAVAMSYVRPIRNTC